MKYLKYFLEIYKYSFLKILSNVVIVHAIRIPENHIYHKKIRETLIYYSNHEAKNKMHIFKFLTVVKKIYIQ